MEAQIVTAYGPRSLHWVGDRPGGRPRDGKAFQKAMAEQQAEDGPERQAAPEPPLAPRLQGEPLHGRREDRGSARHVDVIA